MAVEQVVVVDFVDMNLLYVRRQVFEQLCVFVVVIAAAVVFVDDYLMFLYFVKRRLV